MAEINKTVWNTVNWVEMRASGKVHLCSGCKCKELKVVPSCSFHGPKFAIWNKKWRAWQDPVYSMYLGSCQKHAMVLAPCTLIAWRSERGDCSIAGKQFLARRPRRSHLLCDVWAMHRLSERNSRRILYYRPTVVTVITQVEGLWVKQ